LHLFDLSGGGVEEGKRGLVSETQDAVAGGDNFGGG